MLITKVFAKWLSGKNCNAEIDGVKKIKDETKTLIRVINILSFCHPFVTASTFVGDRHQSRYWYNLVIPPSIYPFTVPVIFVIESMITANSMFISMWYLFVFVMYFKTSTAWMELVR